jgi:phosphocarrier protein HPr
MQLRKIKIRNPHGLHLRPAAELVKFARRFKSDISLLFRRKKADTSSIIDVVSLGASSGDEVAVIIEGEDEEAASRELDQWFNDGSGI